MRDPNRCYLASIALCLLGLLMMPVNANACTCIPVTVSELVQKADIVFQGVIIDIHDVQTRTGTQIELGPTRRVAVFRVTRVWKGDTGEIFEMPSIEKSGGTCLGFPQGSLVVGHELLVYAYRRNDTGEYFTGMCSHTSLLTQTKDLQELGRGRAPRKKVN